MCVVPPSPSRHTRLNFCHCVADQNGMMGSMMQDLAFAIPGVDEAMSFAEIMKQVKSMEYSVIVFDTAPTGHTLRFLSFPTVLEKALGKLSTLSGQFGPMIKQMSSMMGGQQDAQEDMFAKLESMREVITEVNTQFKDPVRVVVFFGVFVLTWGCRRKPRSYACAYLSSYRSTRRSGSCKNSRRTRSTRTTLSSTSCFSPRNVRPHSH